MVHSASGNHTWSSLHHITVWVERKSVPFYLIPLTAAWCTETCELYLTHQSVWCLNSLSLVLQSHSGNFMAQTRLEALRLWTSFWSPSCSLGLATQEASGEQHQDSKLIFSGKVWVGGLTSKFSLSLWFTRKPDKECLHQQTNGLGLVASLMVTLFFFLLTAS